MSYSFDSQELLTRLVKYALEGLVVGIVAAILPSKSMSVGDVVTLGLVAAAIFAVLDLVAPAIAPSVRQGVGLGAGFQLIGFPA
jgi:hypothetical protein